MTDMNTQNPTTTADDLHRALKCVLSAHCALLNHNVREARTLYAEARYVLEGALTPTDTDMRGVCDQVCALHTHVLEQADESSIIWTSRYDAYMDAWRALCTTVTSMSERVGTELAATYKCHLLYVAI